MVPDPIEYPPSGAPAPFPDILPTDGMRLLLRYWLSARDRAAMPRRPVFDPLHFPELLPLLQLHERRPDGRYLCRVSGTEVVAVSGHESTGHYLDEVVPPGHRANRTAIFDRSLEAGLPLFYAGRLSVPGREWQPLQRLLLPLADRQGQPRFQLSLLHFEMRQPMMPPLAEASDGLVAQRMMTPAEIDYCTQQSTP